MLSVTNATDSETISDLQALRIERDSLATDLKVSQTNCTALEESLVAAAAGHESKLAKLQTELEEAQAQVCVCVPCKCLDGCNPEGRTFVNLSSLQTSEGAGVSSFGTQ